MKSMVIGKVINMSNQLYDDAVEVFNDMGLKKLVIENFDKKPRDLMALFEKLESLIITQLVFL